MLLDNLSLGLFVGFAALLVASFWDIKTREVPDWLSFSLIFFAIGYSIILSVYHSNIWFFINSISGLIIGLGIGLIMFYTGQWGGGDSKLVMGISAIFGFAIPKLSQLHSNQEILLFMVNTIFVGATYGFIYSFVLAATNFKECKEEAAKNMSSKKIRYLKLLLLVAMILSLGYYVKTRAVESFILFAFSIALFALFYVWMLIRTVENVCMIKTINISELTEGDWIVKPVKKGDKVILEPTKTGASIEDLALLKNNGIKKVTVKIGIPFVPSFLIAYIITIFFSNWIIGLIF